MNNPERSNPYTSPSDDFWEKVRGLSQEHLNERSRVARDRKAEQELQNLYRSTPDFTLEEGFSQENEEVK